MTAADNSKIRKFSPAAIFLGGVILLWAVFSWPCPAHLFSGICSSDRNVEKYNKREMISGDHLQFLYHFWLFSDTLSGDTPLFHNVYEFNEGDDNALYKPRLYYIPFSLIYAAGEKLGGKAFGWNVTGFVSVLMACWFTWLFVGRYTKRRGIRIAATLVGSCFPYRWITLLSGSPTGLAVSLVPALLFGLDIAVRDGRMRGGLIAGMAVFISACVDTHVFFFSVLIAPAWCLIAFIIKGNMAENGSKRYIKIFVALLPALVLVTGAVGLSLFMNRFAGTNLAEGMSVGDVGRNSPRPEGLLSLANMGVSNHAFLGIATAFLLILSAVFSFILLVRNAGKTFRESIALFLLALLSAFVICLALGVNGPLNGAVMDLARKVVPKYSMIRQPVKIYCLLPSIIAVIYVLMSEMFIALSGRKKTTLFLVIALGVVMAVEYRMKISPTVCILDKEQDAYSAVSQDAQARGVDPRVVVIPLWPGDSHWTSLYEYYISLYRIRMLNGYSPVVRDRYREDVFMRLQSINKGVISKDQIDILKDKKIDYILLHEDAFPEKVSPFPVFVTLANLLNHPRLELIGRDDNVWAFRILEEERDVAVKHAINVSFPARRYQAEHSCGKDVKAVADESAGNGHYVSLTNNRILIQSEVVGLPDLRWLVRVRGHGKIEYTIGINGERSLNRNLKINEDDWTWISIPLENVGSYALINLAIELINGDIDIDMALVTAGKWPCVEVNDSLRIPAAYMFHAGYTELSDMGVRLRRDFEPTEAIVYGPLLPLEKGYYTVTLEYDAADVPSGTVLGEVECIVEDTIVERFQVSSSDPSGIGSFYQTNNLPVNLRFVYSRNADMKVKAFVLKRLSERRSEPMNKTTPAGFSTSFKRMSMVSIGILLASVAWLGLSMAKSIGKFWRTENRLQIAVMFILVILFGFLLFRPHEHSFQGLDASAYRLMAKAIQQGRSLAGKDKALEEMQSSLRKWMILDPSGTERITRDRSFEINSLESAFTKPFFYPFLPLCMIGFDSLIPGDAIDYLVPAFGLLFVICCLWFGLARGGLPGIFLGSALIAGLPITIWFFRGCFVETMASILTAAGVIMWLIVKPDQRCPGSSFFALALAMSFHPVMIILVIPLAAAMLILCGGTFRYKIMMLFVFAMGLLPFILQTLFVADPYHILVRETFLSVASIKITILATIIILLAILPICLVYREKTDVPDKRSGISRVLLPLIWCLPVLISITLWQHKFEVRTGFREFMQGTGWPCALVMIFLFLYIALSEGLRKEKIVATAIFFSLPVFLYLNGVEKIGLWSQRRVLCPLLVMAVCCLLAGSAFMREFLRGDNKKLRPIMFAGMLGIMAFHNMVRLSDIYFSRYDHGSDQFCQRIKEKVGNKLTIFDWYHYSVPISVYGNNRVLGLSEAITRKKNVFGIEEFGENGFDDLLKWLRERSAAEEVYWATSFRYPVLEQGVLFEPVFRHSVNIPRIVGEDFFPPKAEMCNVSVTLLRVSPIDECNVPIKRSGKMMDGGPLGLRGNWLRKDMRYFPGKGFKINHWIDEPYFSSSVNDAYRKGDGISGCLASDGAGFVGPLPERGESVIIKLAGKTFRGRNNSIRIESPWNTECLSGPIAFNDKLSEETVVLKRSRGNRENDQRIGVYTIRIDGEFAYGRSEDENVHDVKPLVWVSSLEVILDQ